MFLEKELNSALTHTQKNNEALTHTQENNDTLICTQRNNEALIYSQKNNEALIYTQKNNDALIYTQKSNEANFPSANFPLRTLHMNNDYALMHITQKIPSSDDFANILELLYTL